MIYQLGSHPLVLCKEVVLFWRLILYRVKVLLDCPLLRGLSGFGVSFIGGSTVFELIETSPMGACGVL